MSTTQYKKNSLIMSSYKNIRYIYILLYKRGKQHCYSTRSDNYSLKV